MKIRSGFVSNSSTSSFICGPGVTVEKAAKAMKKIEELSIDLGKITGHNEVLSQRDYTIFIAKEDYLNRSYLEDRTPEGDYIREARGEERVVVQETKDNAIPYGLNELIEEYLDAYRIYLG